MARDGILGTAGHIDHGKTALVQALTGVDCDRLPEERARGVTIDIGFARLTLGDRDFGVVDVPGHERFVRNMLAGATGFDLALLAVAADDGVMPQTREHLEILDLLGVRRGVVALTKCDAVDAATLELRALEVRDLLAGTSLAAAAIVPTSVRTGVGLPALRDALAVAGRDLPAGGDGLPFRLAVDRAFTRPGHGTVVTGTVLSGELRVEDAVAWHRPDGTSELARVRGLNRHGEAVPSVARGQRAAVNLPGVPLDAVGRGHELAAPDFLTPSRVLTVRLKASADGPGVKHRLAARLHLGTGDVQAVVSVLDADRAEPGGWVLAQLFLAEHVVSTWGQPFVLRNSSGERTLGGGRVLQSAAAKLRRREVETLTLLEQFATAGGRDRCQLAAYFAGYGGVSATELLAATGLTAGEVAGHLDTLQQSMRLVELPTRGRYTHSARTQAVADKVLAVVAGLHAAQPLASSHDRAAILSALAYLPEPLVTAVLNGLVREKRLTPDGKRVASADYTPRLSVNQRKLRDKLVEAHRVAGFEPPLPSSFANAAGGLAPTLPAIYEVACAEGTLVQVSADVYLHSDAAAELGRRVRALLAGGRSATVGELRDALGTSRKFAVPIAEYLDRVGVTSRDGDRRTLR